MAYWESEYMLANGSERCLRICSASIMAVSSARLLVVLPFASFFSRRSPMKPLPYVVFAKPMVPDPACAVRGFDEPSVYTW